MEEVEDAINEGLDDIAVQVMDMLNFKVVPKEPGDPGYNPVSYIPSESRIYAAEFMRMSGKIDGLNGEKVQLETRISELGEELQTEKENVQNKDKELQKLQKTVSEHVERTSHLTRQNSENENQLRDTKKANDELKGELEVLRRQLAEKESALEAKAAKLVRAEEESSKRKEELNLQEDIISDIEREKKENQTLISSLREELATTQGKSSEQSIEIGNAQKLVTELQTKLESMEEGNSELRRQLAAREESVSSLQAQLDNRTSERDQLQIECEKYEKTTEALDAQVADTEERAEHELKEKHQLNINLEKKLKELEGAILIKDKELLEMKKSAQKDQQSQQELGTKYKAMRDSMVSLNSEFILLVHQLKNGVEMEMPDPTSRNPAENKNESTTPPLAKLEELSGFVNNKFQSYAENQKKMQEEMVKAKKVLASLLRLINSHKRVKNKAPTPTPVSSATATPSVTSHSLATPARPPQPTCCTAAARAHARINCSPRVTPYPPIRPSYRDMLLNLSRNKVSAPPLQNSSLETSTAQSRSVTNASTTASTAAASSTPPVTPSSSSAPRQLRSSVSATSTPPNNHGSNGTPALSSQSTSATKPAQVRQLNFDSGSSPVIGVAPTAKAAQNETTENSSKVHGVDRSKSHLGPYCLCGQKYATEKNLRIHVNYFTEEWKFKCHLCEQKYSHLVYLNRHLRRAHKINNASQRGFVGCRNCGKKFPSRQKLYKHKRTVHTIQMSKKIVQGRTSSIIMTSQSINNSQQKQKSATMKRISLKLINTKTRRNSHWNVVPTGGDGSSMWESFEEAEDQSQSSQEASTPPPSRSNKRANVAAGGPQLHNEASAADVSKKPGKNDMRNGSGHLYSEIITTIESSVAKTRPRDQGQPRASSSTKAATGTPGKRNVTPQKHEADLSTGLSGYFCTCGLKFKLEDNLTKHIEWTNKMYSNDRKFRCKICEKRFTRNGELRKHLRRVHNVTFTARSQGYGCTVCGRLFSRLNELVRHRRSVHGRSRVVFSNKAKKVKPLPGLRPITSLINDKVTIPVPSAPPPSSPPPTQTNHKAISRIRRIPPVKIPSSQMQTLSVTKKKHEVDRSKRHLGNYCVCGTRARNPNNLRTHIKYFTSEHKFACKICGRHFLYLTYLKHHMSRVHKITDLEQVGSIGCGDCGQSFPSAKEHAQHRKSAHSNPPAVAASRRPEQLPVIATTMLALATMPGVVPQASSSSSGQSTSTFLPSSARPPNPKQYCGKKRKKVSAVSPLQRHGINLSKLPSEHFCVCGSHFETMVALREHILLLVRNESAVTTPRNDGCPPSTTKLTPNQHGHNTVSLSESVTITQTPSDSSRASASKNQSSHSQEPSLLKLHKAVRFSNNPDVFFCFCGHQCESNQQLRQHIEDANQLQVVSTSLQLSEVTITPRPQCQERPSTTTELAPGSSSPSTSRGTETNPVALVHALDKSKEHLGIFCICNLELSSEDHLAAHLQYFALGKKFPCDMCKKLFPGIGALNKHRKLIHKTIDASGKLGCNGCGVIFSTRREIAKHRVKIFTSGGKLANVFCPARILGIVDVASGSNNDSMEHSVNDIQTDETSHGTPPTLATQIAAANSTENWIPVTPSISVRLGPSSNDAEILTPNTTNNPVEPVTSTVHPSTSDQLTDVSRPPHGIDSSKCVLGKFYCYCGQECSTKHTLNRHIRRFTEKFHCRNCGQTFLTAGLLNNHMLRVHKIVQTPSVTCKECTESFPNNMELYHHYRIVHNHGSQWETWEMKYAPPQTPSSSQQDQLSQELPIEIENDTVSKEREDDIHEPVPQDPLSDNTGSRYLCTCGKEFNYPHSLRTHVRAKTNGKIFKCSWCPTRFDQHSNLKKHVRGVHKLEYQNGKFACGICAQTFATHEEVNSHRVTAHHRNRQTQRNRHPLPDNFSETGQVEMDVVVET